ASEIDQLFKICSILGSPSRSDWPEGISLANAMSFKFPTFLPTHLSQVLGPHISSRLVSLLYTLMVWNPSWRSSAPEALKHSFFRGPKGLPRTSASTSSARSMFMEQVQGSQLQLSQKPTTLFGLSTSKNEPHFGKRQRALTQSRSPHHHHHHNHHHHNDHPSNNANSLSLCKKEELRRLAAPVLKAVEDDDVNHDDDGYDEDDLSDLIATFSLSPLKRNKNIPESKQPDSNFGSHVNTGQPNIN
ncbi:hypothetical protein TCAL_11225, partial [Tigriopus californicus]